MKFFNKTEQYLLRNFQKLGKAVHVVNKYLSPVSIYFSSFDDLRGDCGYKTQPKTFFKHKVTTTQKGKLVHPIIQ